MPESLPTSRDFHLGDILTVTSGLLLSPTGMGGVYAIPNFMTNENLFTYQLPRVADECKPWLLRQHPRLGSPEVDARLAELRESLDTAGGQVDPGGIVLAWLASMGAVYGERLPVEPIPADDHERKDPFRELIEMRGGAEGVAAVIVE